MAVHDFRPLPVLLERDPSPFCELPYVKPAPAEAIYVINPCRLAFLHKDKNVAKLVFNGHTHQIKLVNDAGEVVGTWVAYNNVDRHATLTHVRNGAYAVTDRRAPRRHTPHANGPYGLHGIIRFEVPRHPGIGVHAARAAARDMPGPAHATMGCIRTFDEAMQVIAATMGGNPLTSIEVVENSAPSARAGSHRNRHRRLHGRHHG